MNVIASRTMVVTGMIIAACTVDDTSVAQEHFDPKGKPPSLFTLELFE